jgi:hypothetical protein
MHLQQSYQLAIHVICTYEKFIQRLKGVCIQKFFQCYSKLCLFTLKACNTF